MKLKLCPFCESDDITVNGIVNSNRFMQCNSCLSHGPAHPYVLEGLENLWNNRPREEALEDQAWKQESESTKSEMAYMKTINGLTDENEQFKVLLRGSIKELNAVHPPTGRIELIIAELEQALKEKPSTDTGPLEDSSGPVVGSLADIRDKESRN